MRTPAGRSNVIAKTIPKITEIIPHAQEMHNGFFLFLAAIAGSIRLAKTT